MNLNDQILANSNRETINQRKAELKKLKIGLLNQVGTNLRDFFDQRQYAQSSYRDKLNHEKEIENENKKNAAKLDKQENETYRFFGDIINQLTENMKVVNSNDRYCSWQISSKANNGLIENVFLPGKINISLLQFLCDTNGIIFSTSFDENEATMYFEVSPTTNITLLEREEIAKNNLENMLNFHRSLQLDNVLNQDRRII